MHDWLYSAERMEFRAECLVTLLKKYGSELDEEGAPKYSMESIHSAAHDWVSHGNTDVMGITDFFLLNYTT